MQLVGCFLGDPIMVHPFVKLVYMLVLYSFALQYK